MRGAALANTCWLASSLMGSRRFHRALHAPAEAQASWLRAVLARDARSAWGQAHDMATMRSYADFVRGVPLAHYSDLAPYIIRIQAGESDVLSTEPVTHLAVTSGSTGARKFIPFTRGFNASFNAAVAPWLLDLARQRPRLVAGPAYWSVSPLADADMSTGDAASAVPIGFADDAEYLGGSKASLVRQVLAVPASVRHVRAESTFFRLSLLALLRQRELRLISVWHPSFLELLVGAAPDAWSELVTAVASGRNPWEGALPTSVAAEWEASPQPARAAELRRIGARDWPRWWPSLQVVSSWGEQAADPGWRRLRARLPHVLVQRKGLLATEAVVTVPIGDSLPLAITSHFFEFLDASGEVRRAHEVERGAQYEVVVTNGAGLWRYRLGDMVECTGHVAVTPSLRFLGRASHVSDLRGEKLSEAFVAQALSRLWEGNMPPDVVQLRAWDSDDLAGYELLLSTDEHSQMPADVASRLERVLRENPNYALARRLGQLAPVRAVVVASTATRDELRSHTGRLGDAKPQALVRVSKKVGLA